MRAFSAFCFVSLQVGVFLANAVQPVVAQQTLPSLTSPGQSPAQPPTPPPGAEVAPTGVNNEVSPQFTRYILGPGDVVNILLERTPGPYRLGPGDAISVSVLRFPDLSFQAAINPEGNIIVPLLGTVSLQNLTFEQAQEKIRSLLSRYVADPDVTLALISPRPDFNLSVQINPEGNIVLPQVGIVSLQGLTVEEAQEKVRLALDRIFVKPVVALSLVTPRPVQITISGEVTRPGIYPINPATPRINEALLTAGGSTMTADLRQVQVRRKLIDGSVVTQNVDLYTPLQNGGVIPNLRLQDGDAIIVPRRELANDDAYDRNLIARSTLAQPQIRIRVLNYAAGGIVTQSLPNGSTFIDALSGLNPDNTNLREIALVRFDPERGKAVTQRLDGKKALAGDASQNVPLQDNDVIVVGRNLIGRITNLLSTVTRPFFDIRTFLRFFGGE